jgi:hypothetical protein
LPSASPIIRAENVYPPGEIRESPYEFRRRRAQRDQVSGISSILEDPAYCPAASRLADRRGSRDDRH